MSTQNYPTDVLQEHVDSTPVLIQRLEQWRDGLKQVQSLANGFCTLQQQTTQQLEKMHKQVSNAPVFPSSYAQTPQQQQTVKSPIGNVPENTQLSQVFNQIQTQLNQLNQRSLATANNIKQTVLPPIDQIETEIEKHLKSLRSHGLKGAKEVEKSRELTSKHVEILGSVTSSFGSRQLSTSEDPYVVHRKALAYLSEQISRENQQAEASLQVQQQFANLEQHLVSTIKQSLGQLAALLEGYDKLNIQTTQQIASQFAQLDMAQEWKQFANDNKDLLVPTTNYLRNPDFVTFSNKDHESTRPIVQGALNRKGTVLKQWNSGFYVLSAAGYLYQFKSAEPTTDATPELALFIPESEVNKSSNGDLTFRVVAKDALKTLSTRHKYVFKASSLTEWDTWYREIAKFAGHVDTEGAGAPSASGGAPTASASTAAPSVPPRSRQTPTQTVPQAAVQAQAVPQAAVQAQAVPQAAPVTQAVPAQTVHTPVQTAQQTAQVNVPEAQSQALNTQMANASLDRDPFNGF